MQGDETMKANIFEIKRFAVHDGDGIHFDSYSYRILGSRYFEAYKDIRENL